MKNITLSADEDLIEKARLVARVQHKTLNSAFREWLAEFTAGEESAQSYGELMRSMRHVRAGRHFTREELNER